MNRLSHTGLLMLALACPSLAQEVYSTIEFGVGHALVLDHERDANDSGFVTTATGNLNRWFSVESEFSGHFNLDTWAYVAGPRFTWRHVRTSPYVHLLFGGLRQSAAISPTSLPTLEPTAQTGVGLNIRMTRDLAVSFGGDYRRIYREFAGKRSEVRFNVGFVFGVGTRF